MSFLSAVSALLASLLRSLLSPSSVRAAGVSYSSWVTTTFADFSGYSAPGSPSVSSSASTSTVNINSAFNGAGAGGSPFNSVYNVPVTVSSSSNLAYPFTGQLTNQHTFNDADTGIDVLAGGQVTFHMPSGGTGQ